MLSKGGRHGGGIKRQPRFQRIVNTVEDLPSPLDTEPGTRIIVRETEEVYGINSLTRMWEVIGTLKKVGGKRPEDLADHVDSEGNPHKISLQDVLSHNSTAAITEEIIISGKGPTDLLRMMSDRSALRIGPDAGSKDGVVWINAGKGTKAVLRIVDGDGNDRFVVESDGTTTSSGAARFAGGFKGPASFEDEITASEGVYGAPGYDLVLGGDKGVVLYVGGKAKAHLSADVLKLSTSLGVKGGFTLEGPVQSSLNPAPSLKDLTLGVAQAPWASAVVSHIDAGTLALQVPANSQVAPLKVSGAIPGNTAVLTAGGALGLGTDDPQARLDVYGDLLVGKGLGPRLKLDGNRITSGDTSVCLGDTFVVTSGGKTRLTSGAGGTTISGGLKVEGGLEVSGHLALGGVSGPKDQEIAFSGNSTTYRASLHTFIGPLKLDATGPRPLQVPGLTVDNGDLLGEGDIKGWKSAQLSERLVVGGTTIADGAIDAPDGLTVRGPRLVADTLLLRKGLIKSNTVRLEGHGGSVEFGMAGPNCGVTFEGKQWELEGITKLTADAVKAQSLDVSGPASLCGGAVHATKQGLALAGQLSVGGLTFKKVSEELELSGVSTRTKFELPVGARIEVVLVHLKSDISEAGFLQVGDVSDPDRFASPTTNLKAGDLIRGLAHWERGRAVQRTKGPIVVSGGADTSGKVLVTVHYIDPAAY